MKKKSMSQCLLILGILTLSFGCGCGAKKNMDSNSSMDSQCEEQVEDTEACEDSCDNDA